MKNTNQRFVGRLLSALTVLGTCLNGANYVGAFSAPRDKIVGNAGALSYSASGLDGDNSKVQKLTTDWSNYILSEDGVFFADEGKKLYAALKPKVVKGVLAANALAEIAAGTDLTNRFTTLNPNLVQELRKLPDDTENLPKKGNQILTRRCLGVDHWIDANGRVRNAEGKFLGGNGLTDKKLNWVADSGSANVVLSQDVITTLRHMGIYDPKTGAFETKNRDKLHLDENNTLKNEDDEFCDYLGNKVADDAKVVVTDSTVNGVTREDFLSSDAFWSQLSQSQLDKARKNGKGDKVIVKRSCKCKQGTETKKIATLETLTGGNVYTKSGWQKLSDALKATDTDKQPLPFEDACAALSIDKNKVPKGGMSRWTDKFTKKQKTVTGIVGAVGTVALGGGAVAAWAATRPDAPKHVQNKLDQKPLSPKSNAF